MRKLLALAGVVAASLVSVPAMSAAILSVNFENGTVNPFTATGAVGVNTGEGYTTCCQTSGTATELANHFAAFGAGGGGTGTLSYTFATTPGVVYKATYDYGTLGGAGAGPDAFSAGFIGGPTFAATPNADPNLGSTFTTGSLSYTATGTSATFYVAGGGAPAADAVVDNVTIAAAPEPAAWGLMMVGFGLAGTALRRRRTAVRFA